LNIKNKLTLTMVLVFLIVVVVLGYVYLSSMQSSLDIKAYEITAEECRESVSVVNRLFEMRYHAVQSSANFLIESMGQSTIIDKMSILQYSLGLSGFECYALNWYDKWYKVSESGYTEKQPSVVIAGLYRRVLFENLYEDDSEGLLFFEPLVDNNGKQIGQLVAKLPAEVFWKEISSTDSLKNADIMLAKTSGAILYPSTYMGGELTVSENYKVAPVKIRAGNKTVNTTGMVMPVPNAALNVAVFVTYDHVIKEFDQTVFYFVIVALFGMLVIGATVYFASAHMTRSITDLARYVAKMGTQFETIPERFTQRKDEAGTLSNSFALLLMRLKSALDEKDFLARHDSLTHLRNRYCLERNIAELIGKKRDFAFGLLDLDDFKVINDSLGHDEGDKLLKNLASVLSSFSSDEMAPYRWGGDEFALVIFGDSVEQYEKTLQEVMRRVKDRFSGEDVPHVTVSIGVSIYPESAVTYKNLLITADKALAWAKMTGKVNFCIYEK